MAKSKVLEAAKDLSTNAGVLLETVSRVKRSAGDTLKTLKALEANFIRMEEERKEAAKLAAQRESLEKQRIAFVMLDDDELAAKSAAEAQEAEKAAEKAAEPADAAGPSEAPVSAVASAPSAPSPRLLSLLSLHRSTQRPKPTPKRPPLRMPQPPPPRRSPPARGRQKRRRRNPKKPGMPGAQRKSKKQKRRRSPKSRRGWK